MLGFFHKLLGFLKKVGKFLQNVGIFGRKLWWGQVGIFGKFGGDFLPEPSGNTGWRRSNRRKKPRHRNFFLEIDLHFIEGVTVEFIK